MSGCENMKPIDVEYEPSAQNDLEEIKLIADNDNENCQLEMICTSCYCHSHWAVCEWSPLCQHAGDDDFDLSVNGYLAYKDMKDGKSKSNAAKTHKLSIHDFFLYRKARGLT